MALPLFALSRLRAKDSEGRWHARCAWFGLLRVQHSAKAQDSAEVEFAEVGSDSG